MKAWLRHSALSAVVLAFLPLIELVSPAVGRAQPPPCPPGMYWNFATNICEFPLPPPVYIDPWLPIWVPDVVDADLDLDVDIPSRPSGYRGSRASRWDRARRTEYRASWTSTPTSRWRWVGVAVGDARSQH